METRNWRDKMRMAFIPLRRDPRIRSLVELEFVNNRPVCKPDQEPAASERPFLPLSLQRLPRARHRRYHARHLGGRWYLAS